MDAKEADFEADGMERGEDGLTQKQLFGKRLGEAMRRRGWSDRDLARAVGATRQCASSWRLGKTRPSQARIALVAKKLGVAEGYLLGFPVTGKQAAKMARVEAAADGPALFEGGKDRDKDGARLLDVHFCVSEEERRLLRERCGKIGEPVSAFVRRVVLARVLGEKDRRLRVDLDKGSEAALREMASVRGTTPEREAERILKGEIAREWELLGGFVKEAAAKGGEPRAEEPCAAERRL